MFKEFSLGELFGASKGDVDLQQKDINGKGHYFINSGLDNRGIKGKTDRPAKVFPANTITIDFWGNAYYRDFEYKLATHNHVFSLTGEVIKDIATGLYIESLMSEFPKMFSYNNMATWNKLKILKILLPVKKSADPDHDYTATDIDYEYMRSRIAELERSRIAELDAYLKATGLDDYELTEEDREVLNSSDIKWVDAKITDIFDVINTHSILKEWTSPGDYPYVTAGANDNSVSSYISYNLDQLDKGNCIVIGGKTLVMSYQKDDFFSNDSHNLALYLKEEKYAKYRVYLFLISCLQASLQGKYYWGDSISKKKIQKDIFKVPVGNNGKLNYAYMENYIRAMEKVTIADVVKYKDKAIETTKAVVEQ